MPPRAVKGTAAIKTPAPSQAAARSPSSAASPLTSIVTESRNSYLLLDVPAKSTVSQVTLAAGLPAYVSAFYQLGSKSEEVAANKLLVARWEDPFGRVTWLDDGAAIRKALKVGDGKISVSTGKLIGGMTLWIQSTSANRALLPDTKLIVRTAGNPTPVAMDVSPPVAAVAAAAPAPVAAKKLTAAARKRKATEEVSQEEEKAEPTEDEAEDEEIVLPVSKKPKSAPPSVSAAASGSLPPTGVSPIVTLRAPSGASYSFLPVGSAKQTIDACTSQAGLGILEGLYQVGSKKEDISAGKDLVLVQVDRRSCAITSILADDAGQVRKLLKKPAGKITLNATMVAPAGDMLLFVQSTSSNRGLLPGTTLCVRAGAGAAASGPSSGTHAGHGGAGIGGQGASLSDIFAKYGRSAPTAAAEEEDEPMEETNENAAADEEDEDDEDEEDGDSSAAPFPPLSPFLLVLPAIHWAGLIGCEGENIPDLFPQADSPWRVQEDAKPVYTDQVVPKRVKEPTRKMLDQVQQWTAATDEWRSDPVLEARVARQIQEKWGHTMTYTSPDGDSSAYLDAAQPPIVVHALVHRRRPGCCVISLTLNALFQSEHGTAGQFFFVTSGARWCLVGSVCDYPIVHANDFCYQHTEERPSRMAEPGMDCADPKQILRQMRKYFQMFTQDKQEYD